MSKLYNLKIVLPDNVFLDKEVKSISFKTTEGSRSVMANHQAYCGNLLDGEVTIYYEKGHMEYALFAANMVFKDNECLIIAEMAAKADEVEEMLEKRRQEIEALYKEELKGDHEIRRVHMGLHRALLRKSGE